MEQKQKGLYQKYEVRRSDGKEITQGSFVLELKDSKARKAILTYAAELEKEGENKDLAYDLKSWVAKYEKVDMTPATVIPGNPPNPNENREVMLFDRIVLVPNDKLLDEDTLYVVPPDQVDEYKNDSDLVLPAVLSVDISLYLKYHDNKAKNAKALEVKVQEDPLLAIVVEVIRKEFEQSDYSDFPRFWIDHIDKYKSSLGNKYTEVGESIIKAIKLTEERKKKLSESPNHSN